MEQAARKLCFLNYIIYLENILLENFVLILHIYKYVYIILKKTCTFCWKEELYFKCPSFSLFLPCRCIFTWYRDIFGSLSAWLQFIEILIWTLALWLWNMPSHLCLFLNKKNEITELKSKSLNLWFFPKPTSFWLLYLYFPGRIVSLLYKIMFPMCFCPALVY